ALGGVTAVVVLVAPWVWRRTRLRPLLALAAILLVGTAMTPTSIASWPPPGWVFVACDVGQGDGLVLNSRVRVPNAPPGVPGTVGVPGRPGASGATGATGGGAHAVVVDAGKDP